MTNSNTLRRKWGCPEVKAMRIAQARALKEQAGKGGLRFEAYLPPGLAEWLLDLIERGVFADPSEAATVIVVAQRAGAARRSSPRIAEPLLPGGDERPLPLGRRGGETFSGIVHGSGAGVRRMAAGCTRE